MNFVVVYGPTSAGKLTVAKELSDLTDYKLLDNHKILNATAALFPFEDPELNPIRMRLGRKFRLEMFEEAAKTGVDFITTMIIATPDSFDFIREAITGVELHGGKPILVQLKPSKEAIMKRVESPSRDGVKVSTKERLESFLAEKPMQFETFPDREHLIIDNSDLSPLATAKQIAIHYKLPNSETD